MKNRLLALLMAAAMVAAMAPAALAEEIQAEAVAEAAAVEEIAAEAEPEATPVEAETPAEETPVEVAPAEEAAPVEVVTDAAEAVEESTVEASSDEVKEPETIYTGEDIDLETMYVPEQITLGYTELKINVGESIDVKAIVTPYNYENSNAELVWTSTDKNYVTVDAKKGNICTITGVKATPTGEILSVSSVQNPKATVACRVFVGTGSTNRPITDVSLDKKTASMSVNGKLTLQATINPGDTTSSKALYWGSDNRDVATVEGGENNTGIIIAKSTGTAHVYVETSNGKYAYCTVTVSVGSIKLDETHIGLGIGTTKQLKATVEGNDKTVTWSSDKPEIATVNANGVVTAVRSGNATITAKSADGLTATCTVTVGSLKLNDTHMSLTTGSSQQLYATVEGSYNTVTWSCDKPEIATVNTNGLVTAVGAGSAVVTAKTADGVTATCTVYVTADQVKVTAFVIRLYDVCLNREPDAPGLVSWTKQLMDGTKTGSQVAYGFIFSSEFKNKNYCNECYTKQLYLAFMGRDFDAPGLRDWVEKLNAGSTREAVFNGFALSKEFGDICKEAGIKLGNGTPDPGYGKGTMPTGPCASCNYDGVTPFVTRLYETCMLREPDAAGLNDWVSNLYKHTKSGRDVAYGFIFSKEFIANNYNNEDYVERLYEAFMGRASDAPGKADWVGKLNSGAMTREKVFDGFVGSQEFMKICGTYGILRG